MKSVKLSITLCLISLSLLLSTSKIEAGKYKVRTIDSDTGKEIPARILIQDTNGQSIIPENSVTLQIGKEIWFMNPGSSELSISSKRVTIRVEKGKEYERVKKEIDLSANDKNEITIVLKRWINMKESGYLSGENHLHRSAEEVSALCASEDLNFGTSLQWWNYPRFGVPDGDSNLIFLEFGNVTTPITLFDVEVEEKWGALYMIGMPNPFPFINDKNMPNLPAAKYGRERGTLNCYQSGWSREVLIDALLGYVDVINVCNNNFHMHRYQPRSRYSNLLEIEGFPVYPDSPEGMMDMNTETYYRMLNCGLRIAAGAGSATGAKETPVGYNRSYVKADQSDGITGYLNSWRSGKNFVTNGPMIFFKTSNERQPGDTVNINRNTNISLHIEVFSDSPLRSVEIVVNGEIVKNFSLEKNQMKFDGNYPLNIEKSSWICARATDSDMLLTDKELEEYANPNAQLNQLPNRLRFAHTSPIYFYVDGKEIIIKKSVEEGLKIVKAFKKFAIKNSSKKYLNEIMDASDKAEEILLSKKAVVQN